MNQERYQMALEIAFSAHKDQLDKAGMPYILHPLRLMFKFEDPLLKIIALLHDVLEDSDVTVEELHRKGFDSITTEALLALTRNQKETYQEFITRVSQNRLATLVKIADLEDNLDVTRLPLLTDQDHRRIDKYHKSLIFLKTFQ